MWSIIVALLVGAFIVTLTCCPLNYPRQINLPRRELFFSSFDGGQISIDRKCAGLGQMGVQAVYALAAIIGVFSP